MIGEGEGGGEGVPGKVNRSFRDFLSRANVVFGTMELNNGV